MFALSGGMAQRLMVARAIFHRPAVLFMDEPTAGLDPQSRLALWEILGELNAAGQTIMLLTHYMEEADRLCNRVAIMDHGKILALDTPAGAEADGRRRHDRDREGGRRRRGAGRRASSGDVAGRHPHARDRRRRRAARQGGRADRAAGRGSAPSAAGFELVDLSVAEPTLETVFINLTGKELRE